ncbi:oxidoreductase [Sphingomonas sp. DBB INV C78]|uniref:SDR family NAD(P)-dependent oxidoreductase n=1 Tax=Sphingomonas sp. DBB INV C78 TaxID=3349434 RepID=UPI0036D2D50E
MSSSEKPLEGKVALVTGASRGIGQAIARRLASAGAMVVVTARSATQPATQKRFGGEQIIPGTLAETVALIEADGGKAIAVPADLENTEQRGSLVARAVAAAGRLDILVNNAGYADYGRIETMSDDTFDRTITHYLRAPFQLIRDAIPVMKAQGAGWIVNIGSVTTLPPMRPYQDYSKAGGDTLYASVKSALHRFTQGLAAEMVDHNIAVNVVGPSTAIRTPGADALIPTDYPTEDVAYLAETVLAMCELPAAERTGHIGFSMHWPHAHERRVMTLDGKTELPPAEPPAWSHPDVIAQGY